jgi:hypothetical protein
MDGAETYDQIAGVQHVADLWTKVFEGLMEIVRVLLQAVMALVLASL